MEQPRLFECMGICVLSPAHESEMRVYLVYVLIVKYLSHRFCLNSAIVYQIRRPYRGIWGGFFQTFLEGSVDHFIYIDYIVNRSFFIDCSLACAVLRSCHLCCIIRISGRKRERDFTATERDGSGFGLGGRAHVESLRLIIV